MTCRDDFTLPAELLERVSKQGFDILPELIQVIINAARDQAKKIVDQAHKREVEIVDEARSTALEEGKRIVDSSRQDAAQEKSRARDELRKDVASLAVAGASRLLQREIDPKAHADLIEQLAREIEGAKA